LNPIFETPIVETPSLVHPINDSFRLLMPDLRAKDKDDREEFVGKGLICSIMYIIYPTTGTTEHAIKKVQFSVGRLDNTRQNVPTRQALLTV
jgi:hypothetical protein